MIVNYKSGGWEVITQRTHGLLAAQIGTQWRKADRGKRWLELLVAIADHDDAQVELQRDDLLTPQGGPLDFKMREFRLEHGQRTMEFSISKSRYIALLCSMHLAFIASEATTQHKSFFAVQKKLRASWRKELAMTEAEAQFDYALLEWCDALSLLICQHENQPEEREVEISNGPDKRHYCLSQVGNELHIRPWPFEKERFELRFESRLIPQLQFDNCAEFKDAWLKAPVNEKTWELVKHK